MVPEDDSLLIFGGPIHTLDGDHPLVEAVGVRGGHIAAVGSQSEVEAALVTLDGRRPRPVDLEGAALFPGFVDGHTHMGSFGLRLSLVDLEGVRSPERAGELVAEFARSLGPGKWVRGGGWNKNLWAGGRFPSRHDLDRVAPHNPVALASKDGHTWWLNTEGLRMVGVNRDTPDPPGGEIERDASGEPTGILKENAGMFVWATVEQPAPKEYEACLRKAVERARAMGLVGVCDMEGRESFKAYQALDAAGALDFRVWLYVPADLVPNLAAVGLERGFGSRHVKIAGVKAFLDGALGSQTADMLSPYEGGADRGMETMTAEAFSDLVAGASAEGLAVAVHAIGDRANRKALDAFETHRRIWHAAGIRHRIEHVQLLDPADLPRLGRLGVVASMQPIHAPSDRDIADRYWGPGRSVTAYAWRSVADSGAVLAFGSDVPVETCDPLQGIFAAVTRRHPAEPGREPWHPEQAVSPEEAVRAYTTGVAWAAGAERERGTIETGKVADFTVLSEDILGSGSGAGAVAGAEAGAGGGSGQAVWSAESKAAERLGEVLLRTKVLLTIVGGRVVYDAR